MRVVFRADASLQIGSGHIMRCLTLAARILEGGGECFFICRKHDGNLIDYIERKGFTVYALEKSYSLAVSSNSVKHEAWLGCVWTKDADETKSILLQIKPDWLVVDHYALDAKWESMQTSVGCKIMVVDDLVDREHTCNILLDQTLGRITDEYSGLVVKEAIILCGTKYSLLRPEFVKLRSDSLSRRASITRVSKILITMGGVDEFNATRLVLDALNCIDQIDSFTVTVVLGGLSSNLESVKIFKSYARFKVVILTDVSNMAELMADHDFAIGAAGSTSWERCCMGLPTAIVILADNQLNGAKALVSEGAVCVIGGLEEIQEKTSDTIRLLSDLENLRHMTSVSSGLVDGLGADRVYTIMKEAANVF